VLLVDGWQIASDPVKTESRLRETWKNFLKKFKNIPHQKTL